jgi:hypothetical protein
VLDTGALIDQVAACGGGDQPGPATWREGLDALVRSADEDARLNPVGEATMASQIVSSLANRAGVLRWHADHPEIAEEAVEAPVFILGLPRCGTTLLSYLLDRDPANRSLLRGECFASTPPPETATLRTHAGVVAAQAQMDALYAFAPEFKAIHYEQGDGPTECITLLGQELRSVHFETLANLPGYSEWHLACDMVPAYRYHRRVLEVLQSRAPGRWVVKSPCHNLALDALVEVYPDARFLVPHRDPTIAIGSMASLVSVLTGMGSDADWDGYIGAQWLELCGLMLDRHLDFRTRHGDDRFLDLRFDDLTGDPMGEVARIYAWLGWEVSPAADAAMRSYLDAATVDRFGRHSYAVERFGLDATRIRARVEAYLTRFDLTP